MKLLKELLALQEAKVAMSKNGDYESPDKKAWIGIDDSDPEEVEVTIWFKAQSEEEAAKMEKEYLDWMRQVFNLYDMDPEDLHRTDYYEMDDEDGNPGFGMHITVGGGW